MDCGVACAPEPPLKSEMFVILMVDNTQAGDAIGKYPASRGATCGIYVSGDPRSSALVPHSLWFGENRDTEFVLCGCSYKSLWCRFDPRPTLAYVTREVYFRSLQIVHHCAYVGR